MKVDQDQLKMNINDLERLREECISILTAVIQNENNKKVKITIIRENLDDNADESEEIHRLPYEDFVEYHADELIDDSNFGSDGGDSDSDSDYEVYELDEIYPEMLETEDPTILTVAQVKARAKAEERNKAKVGAFVKQKHTDISIVNKKVTEPKKRGRPPVNKKK